MSGDDDKSWHVDRVMRYAPTRPSKLREIQDGPPPLPAPEFGAADEDGLRMLAALGELTSLEPDYVVDEHLASEASVTIVDASGQEIFSSDDAGVATYRHASAYSDPGLLLNGYETFLGPGDEAIVEIVEITPALDDTPAAEPTQVDSVQPTSLSERLAATAGPGVRFFKALSGS